MYPAPAVPPQPVVLRPLGGLATATSLMLGVAAVAWAWTVHVWAWTTYGSIARYSDAGFSGAPGVTSVGIRPIKDSIIALGVAMLISAVAAGLFIGWLARARANADQLGPHRFGRGWEIGGWLLPFANLVIPGRVVADVWRASATPKQQYVSTAPVTAWWLTAVGTWLLFVIGLAMRIGAETSTLRTSAVLSTIQGLLTLVAAGLAIVVVQRITRWQSLQQR
jgi:hypothetical protein